jgi:pyruvate,water dikinase
MRRAVLRIAGELVARGALAAVDDVWFLTRSELFAALEGGVTPDSTLLAERRRTWERQRRLAPPLHIGTQSPLVERFIAAAEAAIRGGRGPAGPGADARASGDIVGIPASAGCASGPVRIVHSSDAFDTVQPGDVLVAPMTAPAWTPLFGRVVAIVTDTGGAAAHASIVAREYGLPAVVGTADATRRLRDGDLVEVDGSAGIVRRVTSTTS